jgi:hypothetical protein
MTSTIRSRSTISPMTIVVVREEPAGDSDAAASDLAAASAFAVEAGFGASAVAGADVIGAPADAAVVADVAVVAVFAMASEDGAAVCCEKAEDETRRARRRAGIAERRFMAGEIIGRTGTRQAAMGRA